MRQLRDNLNPFFLPEQTFLNMYRFSRAQAQLLFLEIEPFLNAGQRLTRIPPVVQVSVN